MQLPKPAFPIKYDLEKFKEEIQAKLEENEWEDIIIDFALELIPVYFFHYEIFSEVVSKETNQKRIEKSLTKKGAINANNGMVEPEVFGYPEKFNTIAPEEFQITGVHFSFKKINIQESDIKGIAHLKIAAFEGTAKENVLVTGMELIFVPFWTAKLSLNGNKIVIVTNAVEAKIFNLDKISERLKSFKELIFETLDDLHSPFAWGKYIANTLRNKYVLIGLAILVVAWVFFFNP